MQISEIYIHKQQYNEAIACFKRAIEAAPGLLEAYLALANTYQLTGDLEKARDNYQKVISLNPDSGPGHFQLGLIEKASGNYDRTMACFDEVARIIPGSVDAEAAKADVYQEQGKHDQSYEIVRSLLDRGIQNVTAGLVFAKLCKQQGNCDEAIRYLEDLGFQPNLTDKQRDDIQAAINILKA